MITLYHRPQTLEEALKILSQPNTRVLGGGTVLSRPVDGSFSVVDLQALGLDTLRRSGNALEIGGAAKLQTLHDSTYASDTLRIAIELDTPINLRTMGTVAGTLVTCDGRSTFGVLMLALDAKLTLEPGQQQVSLGNYFPLRATSDISMPGKIIINIEIPLNVEVAFETIARTPADKPIVCAALVHWPSGRTRLALGGWGPAPTLALDGNEPAGLEQAACNAASDAADEWATGEYRCEMAGVLANRCLENISRV
jgi:CO/xanthine dehydrogenase FAD-binding subunit